MSTGEDAIATGEDPSATNDFADATANFTSSQMHRATCKDDFAIANSHTLSLQSVIASSTSGKCDPDEQLCKRNGAKCKLYGTKCEHYGVEIPRHVPAQEQSRAVEGGLL